MLSALIVIETPSMTVATVLPCKIWNWNLKKRSGLSFDFTSNRLIETKSAVHKDNQTGNTGYKQDKAKCFILYSPLKKKHL